MTDEAIFESRLGTADKKEIAAQIRRAMGLSDEHFNCRSLGHSWVQVEPFVSTQFGVPECFYCSVCTMFRVDTVSRRYGELLGRRYLPPDGYYITPPSDGSRNFSASAFRVARLRRTEGAPLPNIKPTIGGQGDDEQATT
jgi:hypothetical protein